MRLSPGTRLGPFEILAPLGAGGMGEVYRARDTRLGRDVAVKILPDDVADDPHALARFETEARAVAALSHPNIVALFDVGQAGRTRYVVTELLQGQTLRLALADGPLPVHLALDIAIQIASALDAAHENGIVHRDLKPENILLGPVARVKLLDFGLAWTGGPAGLPGEEELSTSPGQSLPGAHPGTVAYMSPEQARDCPVDFRSDQFSLGIILYEMLSGTRPFVRDSAAETLTAIIREEPESLERIAPGVPAIVRWVDERLLAKDPDSRYAATRDLVQELESLRSHLARRTSEVAPLRTRRPRRALPGLGALAVAICSAGLLSVLFLRGRDGVVPNPARFEVRLPEGTFLVPHRDAFDVSPDGRLLVFSAFAWKKAYDEQGEPRLYLRPLDSLSSRPIPGTDGGVQPVFSPDGQHVAFAARSEDRSYLRRVPVAGGPVQTICECDAAYGAAWKPDGSILFASKAGPLHGVPASGGKPEPATTLDPGGGEISHRLPHLLPDGRTVLYTSLRWIQVGVGTWKGARIYMERPGGKGRALLVEGGTDGRWAPPGVLLFLREGNLLSASLDAEARSLSGPPSVLLEGVRHAIFGGCSGLESGAGQVTEAGGIVAWVPGSVDPSMTRTKAWVDASGAESPLEGGPLAGPVSSGRVSLDGRRVLLGYGSYPSMQAEVVDLGLRVRRRVTFDVNPAFPIWGPGPERFTFASDHEGHWALYSRRLAAKPDEIERLWTPPDGSYVSLGSWSADGKVLAFLRLARPGQVDIWLLERGGEARRFLATRFDEGWPDFSPDGRWLVYTSNASGQHEVFVTPVSGEAGSQPVSAGAGLEPLWSRDGSGIYYWQPVEGRRGFSALFRVPVTKRAGALAFGLPERVLERRRLSSFPGHDWDVAPDGRFLVGDPPDDAALRAFWNKVLSDRIVVDTGGIKRLLAEGKARR